MKHPLIITLIFIKGPLIIVVAAMVLFQEHEGPLLPPDPIPTAVVEFPSGPPDNSQEGLDRFTESLQWNGGSFFARERPRMVYVRIKSHPDMVKTGQYILHHKSGIRERGITHIAILESKYSISDLRSLGREAGVALSDAGIGARYGSLDRRSNTFELRIRDEDLLDHAREVLRSHGIPLDSITLRTPTPSGVSYRVAVPYIVMFGVVAALGLILGRSRRMDQGESEARRDSVTDLTPHL